MLNNLIRTLHEVTSLVEFPELQGLRFEVVPSWFKETLDKSLFKTPYEYAVETAKQKALEVARRMPFVSHALLYLSQ